MILVSIHDKVEDKFQTAVTFQNKGTALRAVMDELKNEKSVLKAHVDDLEVFSLGEFDEKTGEIKAKVEKIADLKELNNNI